jgi:phosphatidate cytidylyltransferase
MMSPQIALHDPIFKTYLLIVPLTLAVTGIVLAILQYGLKKELGTIWATYRSWLVMAGLGLLFVFLGRAAVIGGVCLISIAAFRELARVSRLNEDRMLVGAVYLAIVAIGVASLGAHRADQFTTFNTVAFFAVSLILVVPVLQNRAGSELLKISLSIVGFVCLGWMFGHVGLLTNSGNPYGFICYVIFATELNDVSAFTFGRIFGRRPLRSEISPRKTIEGALGAIAVSMLLPWVLRFSFPFFGATQLILTGLIVGIGGLLGDLSMSMIKREVGTKDMGTAIPGHGGVLDRIDSLIYVAPLFVYMTSWFEPLR